jgi:DNA-directed RNA polymerase subunit alpha
MPHGRVRTRHTWPSYSGRSREGRTQCSSHSARCSPRRVVSEYRSRFVIEPLEPGFGYTLGNSLRRTLLSSIPGAAVTSIRVDGVLHEFSTIPGVKEDVTEIILNIKDLVVSSEHDEPVVMYLRKHRCRRRHRRRHRAAGRRGDPQPGPAHRHPQRQGQARDGADRRAWPWLRVGQQNKTGDEEIGRIPVDSIYSPVLKVTYKVEATRVEQRTDFDRLIVDVETKKSMAPRDALASAGKTLVELFGLARELNVEAEGIDMGPSPTDAALAQDLALPIEDLDLTVRSYNCLKREGIHTVGELVSRSEADLLDIRNFGAKSIDEVKAKLVGMGLQLKDSPPGFDPSAIGAYDDFHFGGDDDDDCRSPRTSSSDPASGPVIPRSKPCPPPPRVPASEAVRRTSA